MTTPKKKTIQGVFAKAVANKGTTPKNKTKKKKFTDQEVKGVLKLMEDLQLPLPQKKDEFMTGTDGCLIFINRYGTVIRIEEKNAAHDLPRSDRVLQPLAQFHIGSAVVEICPACAFESDKLRYDELKTALETQENLKLWDSGMRQCGRIPLKTAAFPDGLTVVVDRLAVRKLSDETKPIKTALQKQFYAPLLNKMAEAYDGKNFKPGKVAEFWQLCEEFVHDGKLVPGWNNYKPLADNFWEYKEPGGPKGLQAAAMAQAYEKRLPAADNPSKGA